MLESGRHHHPAFLHGVFSEVQETHRPEFIAGRDSRNRRKSGLYTLENRDLRKMTGGNQK